MQQHHVGNLAPERDLLFLAAQKYLVAVLSLALAVTLLCTGAAWLMRWASPKVSDTNEVMIFFLGVAFVAARFGRWPGILGAALLLLGAGFGGLWALLALLYMTAFTFALDELMAYAAPQAPEGQEFPHSPQFSESLLVSTHTEPQQVCPARNSNSTPSRSSKLTTARPVSGYRVSL